jgi:hypothetical protein
MYVVDLFSNTTTGGIEWNVANATPKLMNNPCKIMVKQLTTELKDGTVDISDEFNLRVIHNMNIQSGSNNGSSNSNVLAFIDSFQVRNYIASTHTLGFTTADCKLYAPNGLPNILLLNRASELGVVDNVALTWAIRLEITINPDEE